MTARGSRVHKDYVSKADAIDKKIRGVYPGAPKCVTCVAQYGRIFGPTVGPYSEVSPDFIKMWNLVAAAQTNKALARTNFTGGKWKMFAMHKYRLVQRWGLFFHRGWARLLHARITELYGIIPENFDSRGYSVDRGEQLQAHFFFSSIHGEDRMSDELSPASDGEEEFGISYHGGVQPGATSARSSSGRAH